MAPVTLKAVGKTYPGGEAEVVKGVDLAVADGELLVILGPSGCGKSTLLRMVAGLEAVSRGEIYIGDRLVNRLEPKDRDIAMVFQNYALYPHMSAYDNMAYGLRNRRMAKPEIDRRVRRAAGMLELEPLLARKPRQLSGGQRQRVAMGRAIVREPKLFLFDEPLSNLDAKLRTQMRIEIKRLQRALGVTSLYVTHDQVEAMTLADRMVVMNAGRAEQVGAPLAVYQRPATRFVAGFIGAPAMNLLPAVVAPEGGAVLLDGRPIPAAIGGPGRPVLLGIRPEHLQAAEGGGLSLTIDLLEALGADTLVHGRLPGGRPLIARLPGAAAPSIGTVLPLAIPPAALHLFDAETGLRIGA